MPLKLIPPRAGRSIYWRIRGSYLGAYIDRSTQTEDEELAQRHLKKAHHDIEDGYFCRPGELSFEAAAKAYVSAGGEARYLEPLIKAIGRRPAAKIDQITVDRLAAELFPLSTNATRNRQVYTPISAVLRRANIAVLIHRPKNGQGQSRLHFLTKPDAFAIMAEAKAHGEVFGILIEFLLYTGARISEALALKWVDLDLDEKTAWVGKTKNGDPRNIYLTSLLVNDLQFLRRVGSRVFHPYHRGRPLWERLQLVAKKAGVTMPRGVAFHAFRHSYGAWMRRYAGLDTSGLMATGAWHSRQSASIYEHVDISAEARKADLLPLPPGWEPRTS